jgi:hypothetical protein
MSYGEMLGEAWIAGGEMALCASVNRLGQDRPIALLCIKRNMLEPIVNRLLEHKGNFDRRCLCTSLLHALGQAYSLRHQAVLLSRFLAPGQSWLAAQFQSAVISAAFTAGCLQFRKSSL